MLIETVDSYAAEYERVSREEGAAQPEWLRAARADAWWRFSALGFPTTRQEEWRFTNMAPLAGKAFHAPATPAGAVSARDLAPFRLAAGVVEIVFVDGRLAPDLSSPSGPPRGLALSTFDDVLRARPDWLAERLGVASDPAVRPFEALNTAFLGNGAVVEIAPGAVIEPAVHVVFVSSRGDAAAMTHPRVLVIAGANSQCRLVESYVTVSRRVEALPVEGIADVPCRTDEDAATGGELTVFTNAVTEILLADGAIVDHYRVQREAFDAAHVSATNARLSRGSALTSHAFTFGGGLVRNDVNVTLAGEGADCTLNGLYVANGTRLVDNHTFIDHAAPHCGSHELYKGILDDRAHAVFSGKILVRPDAQKTDAKQTNKTLLLSDDAQINTKPQLEIFANDVKCTHGATVGQLNEDALFYLRARGIGREQARQMLIRAFAADVTARVRVDALRDQLDAILLAHLAGALGGPGAKS